ncbi:hypothetical protein DS901_06670 [Loktanella sp. D2R18]|uniref:hypothetical protein n=1 Tax=Rhodobacterales TaxID=204455 RepID=UPI000DE9761F|nr:MULTISPECIES: hypothetical protein [Rhodobacterales]MDO6589453.1 hypothetical protein [Yoonia sp. 1_MG-2023]RBW44104.1 hypothetical protein DS901_06670 [Loktanella sp. D2R18]
MSSSVIGSLRVNLGLDSAQFERGAKRMDAPLRQMRKQFMAISAVAATTATALAGLTVGVAANAQEIDNFARVANTTPEVFQRWAAGARTVGIEQDKLSDILKDMNDRVGDFAATGGGPMADFFENIAPRVGVTAASFRDLSGAQGLQLFVSSLEQANLSQAEMTFYMEAMAGDSTRLLPLLRDNAAAMDGFGESAASLGVILDQDAIASLRKTSLAIAQVGTAFTGMANRIAVQVAPSLEALANGFVASMQEGGLLRGVTDALINNLDRLAVYAGVAVTAFGTYYVGALVAAKVVTFSFSGALVALRTALIRTGIGALIVVAGELVLRFSRLVESVGGFGNALGLMKNVAVEVFDRIGKGFSLIPQAVQAGGAAMNAWFTRAIGSMAYSFVEFTWTVAEGLNDLFGTNIRGASGVITQELTLAANEAQALADAASATMTATKEAMIAPLASIAAMRAATVAAGEAIADTGTEAGALSERLEDVETAAGGAGSEAESLADTLSGQLSSAWDRVAAAFGDFVANGFKDFKSFASGIKDTFKQLLSDLISAATKNTIMIGLGLSTSGSVANAATGGVSSALGGSGGLLSGLMGSMGGSGGILGAFTGGSGLAAGFSGLAGGSGLLGGLGNTLAGTFGAGGGIGGLFSSIGGGAGLMSSIGAALPIIGIAAAAVSFFKTKTTLLDSGIRATINMEDAMYESFEKIQKSKFWGLSKKTSYKYSALSAAESDTINQAVLSVQEGVVAATAALGISSDVFDGFTHKFKVSLKGLDDAAKEAAFTEALEGLGDEMAAIVLGWNTQDEAEAVGTSLIDQIRDGVFGSGGLSDLGTTIAENIGEGFLANLRNSVDEVSNSVDGAYDELMRLSSSLVTVNDVFRDLGFSAYDISIAGAQAATEFSDLFESLENFTTASAAYYDQFYTDEEKLANASARLTEALADLGVNFVPDTNAAFREMVETAMQGGDLDLAASLIQLAPVFDSVTDAANALETAALEMRGAYQLDGSGYATAFDAKIAYEAANQGAITQDLINTQNEELRRQSALLAAMQKELVKQSNAASDSNVQSSFG